MPMQMNMMVRLNLGTKEVGMGIENISNRIVMRSVLLV